MKIGYARVCADQPTTASQVDALTAAGCQRMFSDRSSDPRIERGGLAQALATLRAGDTFTVCKLDRLGRSVDQIIAVLDELDRRGAAFQSIAEGIDTATPQASGIRQLVAVMAEVEARPVVEHKSARGQPRRRMTAAQIDRLADGADRLQLYPDSCCLGIKRPRRV